jgi:hypothetical protein
MKFKKLQNDTKGVLFKMEKLLKKLTSDLNITLPKKEKDKSYLLDINEDAQVKVWKIDSNIFLKADIILCPMKKREEIFTKLMQANLLGKSTGGAVIGIDEEEKYLTLSLTLPYEINDREFKERLEDFVNFLIYWKDEIIEMKKKFEESIY